MFSRTPLCTQLDGAPWTFVQLYDVSEERSASISGPKSKEGIS
jgi:hypothetical protein